MRNYLLFGSDDGVYWEQLKPALVSGAPQALNAAKAQQAYRHYAVVPARNWTARTPETEERPPVVKWNTLTPDQLTVDDVPLPAVSAAEAAKTMTELAEGKADA
jgi:hypothetical protein